MGIDTNKKTIVLATKNVHKIEEIQSMFDQLAIAVTVESAETYVGEQGWIEDGNSFRANALIKARLVAKYCPHPILADDSGLEVEALAGAPGVRSSSYGGIEGDHLRNTKKLLGVMQDIDQRQARFVCCLCYLEPGQEPRYFEGYCQGSIATKAVGRLGFGYDPVFIVAGQDKTLAELGADFKNRVSHRAKALSSFLNAWEKGLID